MENYYQYVARLDDLVRRGGSPDTSDIHRAINGQAYEALRELVPIEERRMNGAFFTAPSVSRRLVEIAGPMIGRANKILDPACGAGDLLLAAAQKLPIEKTLALTLRHWSKKLHGFDSSAAFVKATRLRLTLSAIQRGNFSSARTRTDQYFRWITCRDALQEESLYGDADFVLVNPPFQSAPAPKDCSWATGKVSMAARFLDHLSRHLPAHARIYAVLPEVLRCGTRYSKFRLELGERLAAKMEQSIGRFDAWADVDVFLTRLDVQHLARKRKNRPIFQQDKTEGQTVGDLFTVRVGALVAYRDKEEGPERLYLETRNTPPWHESHISAQKRKFSGTVFEPPFVVLRRTSRPGDKYRAIGTIVRGVKKTAVENHLLVALPRRGTVKDCKELLRVLKDPKTNDHLDGVMRCRHLTTNSVMTIPWRIG